MAMEKIKKASKMKHSDEKEDIALIKKEVKKSAIKKKVKK